MALTAAQQVALAAVTVVIENEDIGGEKVVSVPVADKNGEVSQVGYRLPYSASDAEIKAAMVKCVARADLYDVVDGGLKSKPRLEVRTYKTPTATVLTAVGKAVDSKVAEAVAEVK
jgi:hypothetical protein